MDSLFGIHEKSLLLREKRSEILANNIANADTPGYLARDFDFAAVLNAQLANNAGTVQKSNTHHISIDNNDLNKELAYRMPVQGNLDKNTVDSQLEQAHFAENTIHYMATLNFINQKTHLIMCALKGE